MKTRLLLGLSTLLLLPARRRPTTAGRCAARIARMAFAAAQGLPLRAFRDPGWNPFHRPARRLCHADTWYPSWASDGNLYSPWTDGNVNGLNSGSGGKNATTGSATILGDDPLKLKIVDQAVYKSDPSPYAGRYPCGSLVHNGIWYYGTYCLHPAGTTPHEGANYNWPWLGPFVGFRTSTDLGKTWTQTPCTPAKPLFGESALHGEAVKIGSPHFVDLGKNLEHSPDGKAYLVAHGASDGKNRRFGYNSWITGDEIYLLRVAPSIENINDAAKYEFFDGAAGPAISPRSSQLPPGTTTWAA